MNGEGERPARQRQVCEAGPSYSGSTDVVRFSSLERMTRFTSGIFFSTMWSFPERSTRGSVIRLLPARSATSLRSAGCAQSRRANARIPNESTIFPWSFLL